jgi:hypothetical protein
MDGDEEDRYWSERSQELNDIFHNRAPLVRAEVARLRACLDETDLWFLRRAQAGFPLTVLEYNDYPDGSGRRAIEAVEVIIKKLIAHYYHNPPKPYHWPYLGPGLNELRKRINDLHEALAAGQNDNAVGRAIAIGTGISWLGFWLLTAPDAAAGAASRIKGAMGRQQPKEPEGNPLTEQLGEEALEEMKREPRSVRKIAKDLSGRHGVNFNTLRGWLKRPALAAELRATRNKISKTG